MATVSFILLSLVSLLNAIGNLWTYFLLETFEISEPQVPLLQPIIGGFIKFTNDTIGKAFGEVTPRLLTYAVLDLVAAMGFLVLAILVVKRVRLGFWLGWLVILLILGLELSRLTSQVKEEVFIVVKIILLLIASFGLFKIKIEFRGIKVAPQAGLTKENGIKNDSLPQV